MYLLPKSMQYLMDNGFQYFIYRKIDSTIRLFYISFDVIESVYNVFVNDCLNNSASYLCEPLLVSLIFIKNLNIIALNQTKQILLLSIPARGQYLTS